jgi:hypothetical protein
VLELARRRRQCCCGSIPKGSADKNLIENHGLAGFVPTVESACYGQASRGLASSRCIGSEQVQCHHGGKRLQFWERQNMLSCGSMMLETMKFGDFHPSLISHGSAPIFDNPKCKLDMHVATLGSHK